MMNASLATRPGFTLDNDRLRRLVPSVFATTPAEKMSTRYRQVPTIEVVDILRGKGFLPVSATQSMVRIEGRNAYSKHMLRFRHTDHLDSPRTLGGEIPELVLTNSHDGSSSYQFAAGIFRLVCSNGMVVCTESFGNIGVRHTGREDFTQRILDATFRIVEDTPKVLAQIDAWKQISLPAPVQLAFASAARELLPDTAHVQPRTLLADRRNEDRPASDGSRSLWTTLNVVQEHVMKGGDPVTTQAGKRQTTRPVKSVDRDLKLNKALWTLAAKLFEALGA